MSKICAQCSKTVYPLEELKCLEKIWHKTCFKCTECGMALNMKNYKGYDKKPYCNAHYPQTKATVVAETPELARVTQNTKIQSQIKYHEDFEKMKGTKIEVADNPELRRVKRIGSLVSQVEYKGLNKASDARRPSLPQVSDEAGASNTDVYKDSPYSDRSKSHSTVYTSVGSKVEKAPPTRRVGSIADYDPMNENYGSLTHGYHPTSRTNSMSQEWEETVPLSPSASLAAGNWAPVKEEAKDTEREDEEEVLGRGDNGPPTNEQSADSQLYNDPDNDGPSRDSDNIFGDEQHDVSSHVETNHRTEIAATLDYSNVSQENGTAESTLQADNNTSSHEEGQETAGDTSEHTASAAVYRAVYSYEAQDEDEVGFAEGDRIIDAEPVAEGWMMGTVEKTGQRGMLPSNYIEPAEM